MLADDRGLDVGEMKDADRARGRIARRVVDDVIANAKRLRFDPIRVHIDDEKARGA